MDARDLRVARLEQKLAELWDIVEQMFLLHPLTEAEREALLSRLVDPSGSEERKKS